MREAGSGKQEARQWGLRPDAPLWCSCVPLLSTEIFQVQNRETHQVTSPEQMLGAWARPRRSTPPERATCCHALATSGSRACNCLAQGAPNVSAPFPNKRGSSWHFPAPMVLGSRPHECMRGPSRVALRLWGGGGHPAGRWNRLSPGWGGAQLRATRSTQRGCSGGASEG